MENAELNNLIEEREEAAHLENQEIKVAQEQLQTVLSVRDRISSDKGVCRNVAQTLRTITTGLESMESHFQQYPVLSYSQLPSKTNLKVTQEGIGSVVWETVKRIAKAILNAIAKGWNFIATMAKKIYGFFFRSQKAAKQTEEKTKAIGDVYRLVFDSLSEDSQERLTADVASHHLAFFRKFSSSWTEVHQDLMEKGPSNNGVIKIFSTLPSKLMNDSTLFISSASSLEKAIKTNGVEGFLSTSKVLEETISKWDNDFNGVQTAGVVKDSDGGYSSTLRYAKLYETVGAMVANKIQLKEFTTDQIATAAKMLAEVMNGQAGKAYGAMLFEVSMVTTAFQSLEKRYHGLLNELKTPDERINNEALVAMKTMMDAIHHGFKACSFINQQINECLTLINNYNDGLLKIYVRFAKEGGLSPEQRLEVQKRLGSLLKIY